MVVLLLAVATAAAASAAVPTGRVIPISAKDDGLVLTVADLPGVVRAPLRSVAGFRLESWSPSVSESEVVETDFHDPHSTRVKEERAKRLLELGTRRAARAEFEYWSDDRFVFVTALVLPTAAHAARAAALLESVHRDSFRRNRRLSTETLGSGVWGYFSQIGIERAWAFGFHVGNLAVEVQVWSIGGDFRAHARTLALEVIGRARARATS